MRDRTSLFLFQQAFSAQRVLECVNESLDPIFLLHNLGFLVHAGLCVISVLALAVLAHLAGRYWRSGRPAFVAGCGFDYESANGLGIADSSHEAVESGFVYVVGSVRCHARIMHSL